MRSLILYLLMDFGISSYAVSYDGSTFPMVMACAVAVILSFFYSVYALRNQNNKLLFKSYGLSASAFVLFMAFLAWLFTEILPGFSFFPKSGVAQNATMYYAIISYLIELVLRIALLALTVVRNLRSNHRNLGS